jgi:aryl sulfotransferase
VDALVFSPRAKYIYVGRDGRDILWSLYNHHVKANDGFYEALNDTPGLVGPRIERTSLDVVSYFRQWLEKDGYPFWSLWENVRSWWQIRNLPNVKLVHFSDLKRDLPGQMRGIASFLEVTIDEANWPGILEHCSFDYMKRNADKYSPMHGEMWEGGAKTFINKGTNGRWRDLLSPDDVAAYEARALRELGPECANWLANGRLPA